MKNHLRPDGEEKFNSPWNIAADFNMDMGCSISERSSLLDSYWRDKKVSIDTPEAAASLLYYTSGYPFLDSCICKILDEKVLPAKGTGVLDIGDIDTAVQHLLKERNTNFDSLAKNLENNPEFYEFIKSIAVEGELIPFHVTDNLSSLAKTYGMLREEAGNCKIHNRIYEQLIYDHMTVKLVREKKTGKMSR
ncbi:MAG: hypothetical protein GY765_17830 [bacterium]|nr:hypothetical protein [bacterium]